MLTRGATRRGLLVGAVLLCTSPTALLADDSTAALGAGGIELLQSDSIAMLEQDLFLAARKVRTRFVFQNESRADIKTLVAFVMPDIEARDLARRDNDDIVDHLGFTVTVDGRKIVPKADIRARLDGKDVTDRLKQYGIALRAGQKFRDIIPQAGLTLEQKAKLRADGLLHENFDDVPGWDTRLRLYWEQVFPAGAQVEIYHGYTPFLGTENILPATISNVPLFTDRFCMDAAQKKAAATMLETTTGTAHYLDYILSTGSSWKGPIRRLAITIEREHAGDMALTCLPGLKPVGPTSAGVGYTDAKPQEDISVLFISRGSDP